MKNLKHFALTMLVALVSSISAYAHDFEVANSDGVTIYYTKLTDNTCAVSYRGDIYGGFVYESTYTGTIVIPSSVSYEGTSYSVTAIGERAFRRSSGLTSVVIPNSVTTIGDGAFYECTSLESFTGKFASEDHRCLIVDGVLHSFAPAGLNSYTIPISVTTIGEGTFANCSALKSVVIPNSVTTIGNYAFNNCRQLASLTIGAGVTSVGEDAFFGCLAIYKMTLLPNTEPVGLYDAISSAYSGNGRITYVPKYNYSGSKYGTIRRYDYLSSMFEVDGVKYVPVSPSEKTCAAIDCDYNSTHKDIVIGENVSYGGEQMKIVEINPYLFAGNSSIESIEISIPLDIPDYFARSCGNLQTVKLNTTGRIGNNAFQMSGLKTASLAEGITDIGSYAFRKCSKLESINIPKTVTTIYDNYTVLWNML